LPGVSCFFSPSQSFVLPAVDPPQQTGEPTLLLPPSMVPHNFRAGLLRMCFLLSASVFSFLRNPVVPQIPPVVPPHHDLTLATTSKPLAPQTLWIEPLLTAPRWRRTPLSLQRFEGTDELRRCTPGSQGRLRAYFLKRHSALAHRRKDSIRRSSVDERRFFLPLDQTSGSTPSAARNGSQIRSPKIP